MLNIRNITNIKYSWMATIRSKCVRLKEMKLKCEYRVEIENSFNVLLQSYNQLLYKERKKSLN